MSYITLPQLAEMPGALELAQVASDKHHRPISAQLMDVTLREGDRSGFTPEQIEQADIAAARIFEAIDESSSIIDGYLARRYTLPLPRPPGILVTWARAIVRYKLHPDRIAGEGTDPVVRDYKDAIRFLELVASGKFSLGIDDPTAGTTGAGEIQIHPGDKVFGRRFMP